MITLAGLALRSVIIALIFLLLRSAFRTPHARLLLSRIGILMLVLLPLLSLAAPRVDVGVPSIKRNGRPAATETPSLNRHRQRLLRSSVPAESSVQWLPRAAALLWGVISIAMLARLATAMVRLRRITALAVPVRSAHWNRALGDARRSLGVANPVTLLESSSLSAPLTWGARRPVIVLDHGTIAQEDGAQEVLLHELSHIGRGDWLLTIAARCIVATQWFNPLSLLLVKAFDADTERACDDEVLRCGGSALSYASLLVNAARRQNGSGIVPACAIAHTSGLQRRIAAVLSPGTTGPELTPARAKLVALTVSIVGIAVCSLEPSLLSATVLHRGERPRDAAAWRLDEIGSPHTRAIASALRAEDFERRRVNGPGSFRNPAAADPLIVALSDPSPAVRRIAAWGLGEIREERGTAALLTAIHDPDAIVRAAAAHALGDIGDHLVVPQLVRLLDDVDPAVRMESAHALGDLRDPAAEPALREHKADGNPDAREAIQWALHELRE